MIAMTSKGEKTKFLKSDIKDVRRMYQDGISARQIAKAFNKSPATICRYLKKENIILAKGKRYLLEKDKDKIIEEYKNGVSVAILCEKYHCYRTTIADLLKHEGITPNRNRIRRRTLFSFTSEIKSLYDQGAPYKDIAKKYGVNLSSISRFVKNKKWTRPRPMRCPP